MASTTDITAARALVERVKRARGRQPVDEHRWALVGSDAGQTLVVADHGTGFVLVTPAGEGWELDLLVDPDRRRDPTLIADLVARSTAVVADGGGGATQLWIHDATDVEVDAAVAVGLDRRRDLHQMRVRLPLAATADPITTRPFQVGRDEQAWLEANAAAFATHPDQGDWTLDDLRQRESEDWFDPEDFLIHDVADGDTVRLAAFNWTKHHPDGVGEIYVIGVHPDFAGRGLGRRLCVAGLDHLAAKATTGMLYVDADNEPAVGLYESLGFEVDHTNTAMGGTIS